MWQKCKFEFDFDVVGISTTPCYAEDRGPNVMYKQTPNSNAASSSSAVLMMVNGESVQNKQ